MRFHTALGEGVLSADGLVHPETKRISNGVLHEDVDQAPHPAAVRAVDDQINSITLPQLRSICRSSIGGVDPSLPVFPPQRVYDRVRRPRERITSETDCFVLCHNDLCRDGLSEEMYGN
ncbi:hypothetical protein QBC33DRAFT_562249 [Phialemonium atrogriseum]|uniref:Uncharacterized protein n=1 Tax=Phialemonium atrogriseum TaxID=1093897 RepID=A0AAJ0BVQ4_9PEZI|nr:uncharacterized protein QBC33DRAFT_562249 [Phialemonium atrogriseum]KAK1763927.1 hypothetical protein QBC33DRAFT_562249 [Phialemonium atrogriseum]